MNAMNESSPGPDVSEALSTTERAFRAELNQKLRAPLNAIIGFAELLAMRSGGSASKEADIQHILKAARDVLAIINEELGEGGINPRTGSDSRLNAFNNKLKRLKIEYSALIATITTL